jgi:predicted transcriptional regulator
MPDTGGKTVSFFLDHDEVAELEAVARSQDRTRSSACRIAVRQWLKMQSVLPVRAAEPLEATGEASV